MLELRYYQIKIQNDLGRLHQWVHINRMKFSQDKYEGPAYRNKKYFTSVRWGGGWDTWLGSQICGKYLGVLVAHKWNMSQRCDAAV